MKIEGLTKDQFFSESAKVIKLAFVEVDIDRALSVPMFNDLQLVSRALVGKTFGHYPEALKYIKRKFDFDRFGYYERHSLTTAILACSLFEKSELKNSSDDHTALCLAALVHDFGMLTLAYDYQSLLELTPAQLKEVWLHPENIGSILSKLENGELVTKVKQMVIEHHEQANGRGYPLGLSGEMIDPLSSMLSIASVYSSLREDRPYRRGFNHEKAKIIMEGEGGKYKKNYLELFMQIAPCFEI